MNKNESEFERKIQTYSKTTLELTTPFMTTKDNFYKLREIVISCKTEEEVVKRLKEVCL